MAQIVPENGLSVAVAAVRVAIAATPAWQAWTRADQKPANQRQAAAEKRVHLFALPEPERGEAGYTADELDRLQPACGLTLLTPTALQSAAPNYRLTRTAAETFVDRSTVYVHVLETVDAAISQDNAKVLLGFYNRLGGLMDAMLETYDVKGAAFIQSIELSVAPHRAKQVQAATQGDFVQAMLRVETGLGE